MCCHHLGKILSGYRKMKKILTIAGSDSCAGAGIQADLKAMSALGVYGMSVIVAVTAQNTMGVFGVQEMSEDIIERQIKAIFEDIKVDSVKTGMLSSAAIIRIVAEALKKYSAENIVIDPVMVAKSGYKLLKEEAVEELKKFISLGVLVTPNIPEGKILSGMDIKDEEGMVEAAKRIQQLGARNVLMKGGHRVDDCTDVLLLAGGKVVKFPGVRIATKNTSGTGCTLSASIASFMGKGYSVEASVRLGKAYVTEAIRNAFSTGQGVGPVGHFTDLYKRAGIKYE